ncbi:virulence RhuM family protein [Mucilaginibacter sp. JRF]|uniref:virulence RhuM family protein n=1 Tax=Mucilaginibacter sp. JRF TaxID=2780088 RepID=UPI00187F08B1|nr:virulence RhuM family protein [Mucilaginibacter sp. JRF]MBE9585527.1 virulence RhuM family protein [Mucilaginibacter sp. JRF]
MTEELSSGADFLFYTSNEGKIKVQILSDEETVWATQKGMAEIFGVSIPTVNEHLQNIFKTGELNEISVIRKIRITANDGKKYLTNVYNLDTIISVGYRINSYQATQFRIWATNILKEYLVKGFTLDDDRLKQSKTVFGKDYFDELLERIKEIRASERRFYQKITDIYAQCSADYDKNSPITQTFFATVQNKLEFAITQQTAGEIVKSRANSKSPNMGLTTWKNSPDGKVLKTDVSIAKNYLTQDEISELNSIVNMYLDYADLQAKRNRLMEMSDWVQKLDDFLKFNEYEILQNSGSITAKLAKEFAEKQYEQFRVVQDKNFQSDFDKISNRIIQTRQIPKK